MLIKIFISWSGPKSKKVALALREWLPNVVQFLDPWMSSEDIDKGARWNSDVATQLEQSNIGIICLTPENLDSPWILFEAGALSKTLNNTFVCPYLFGLDPLDIRGPLLQFQATVTNKEETHKLLCTICKALEGAYLSESRLNAAFERWWPSLEEKLKEIESSEPIQMVTSAKRTDRELLEELLELTRSQAAARQVNPAAMIPLRVESVRPNITQSHVTRKGVINPAIFEFLGKKMRMAFLSVDNLVEIGEKIRSEDFETLTTIGPHNLIITHLSENRYDMIYDIERTLNWKQSALHGVKSVSEITEDVYNSFPFFHVDVYLKILGFPIDRTDLSVFSASDFPIPNLGEIVKILRLGTDWDDIDVSKEERNKFLNRKWILSAQAPPPESNSYIVTIFLGYAGPQLEARQVLFERKVISGIVDENIVVSIYRGRSQGLDIHYVLRISSNADPLYALLESLDNLASEARITIKTETYVVIRRESKLSLEKAALVPNLPSDEANFRNIHIAPRLSNDERVRLIYLPKDMQREFIAEYRQIQEAMSQLAHLQWFQDRREEIERNLTKGLLNSDFNLLRSPHDVLFYRVETILKNFINEEIKDEQFNSWKESLGIPSQKHKTHLTFREQIELTTKFLESDSAHPELLESVRSIYEAFAVRNAFVHGDLGRITRDSFIGALIAYCNFLSRWDHEFNY